MSSAQDSSMTIGHHQTITGAPEFFAFLGSESGLHAIAKVESDYDAETKVEGEEIFVHPVQLLADIERDLKNLWHDYEFNKTMRIKLLNERAQSWLVQYPKEKAAIILFNRAKIIRDARLVDLTVEGNGDIMAFGCVDGLSMARDIIETLLSSGSCPSDAFSTEYRDTATVVGSNSDMNIAPVASYQVAAPAYSNTDRLEGGADGSNSIHSLIPAEGLKKETLELMVKSIDAPRLIGSRGINKRKIEAHTQCHITLHTENKKNGEFPVEIVGWSMEKCIAGRKYIQNFLSDKKEEMKKEQPKIHLAITPRKLRLNRQEEYPPIVQ